MAETELKDAVRRMLAEVSPTMELLRHYAALS
jgi:hypothetical protein